MSNIAPPSEVAEDYKSSLEDLACNSRLEISNLTVIAKENIHAAQAIARVLEEHIDKVSIVVFLIPAQMIPFEMGVFLCFRCMIHLHECIN